MTVLAENRSFVVHLTESQFRGRIRSITLRSWTVRAGSISRSMANAIIVLGTISFAICDYMSLVGMWW
jgi:hypothetical protein